MTGEGTLHAATVLRISREFARSGDYEFITMNRAWKTATGRESHLATRPDIIGVRRDGRVDAFEIRSPSQDPDVLLMRLESEMQSLDPEIQGVFDVFELDPE